MKKGLLSTVALAALLLVGCTGNKTPSKSEEVSSQPMSSEVTPSEQPSEEPSEEPSEQPSEEPSEEPSEQPSETPSEEPSEALSEEESEEPSEESSSEIDLSDVTLKVDYQNIGGANIPDSWDDNDDESKVREASFEIKEGIYFDLDFVGKWKLSTNHGELQTKKSPASYIRSAGDIVVKKVVIEVFSADVDVYLTSDHTGAKVSGIEVDAVHSDGDAYSYDINSAEWSLFPVETYKGNSINIYSFTFYF